jgi:peptide/nickel transport system substrate-binding protein
VRSIRSMPSKSLLVALSAMMLVLGASVGTASANSSAGHGTVTFAEQPQSTPNYIFPMQSAVYLNFTNASQFAFVMWVPLYETPVGKPGIDNNLSIGEPPVYSDNNTVVTVTLKHWVWSNGQPITARDVVLWMNLLSAVTDPQSPAVGSSSAPGPGWGEFVPGLFPQSVVSYTQTGTYTVVFHLNASYDPTWYTDNELTQIWPIPTTAWDRLSASGPVGNYDASAEAREVQPASVAPSCSNCYIPVNPGTATSGALGVAEFLNSQSQDLSTYSSNPLWQVVSGSFKLSQFTTSGFVKLVPNPLYSGTPKPTIGSLQELPFTSDEAEFDSLRSGSLDIGYIPPNDIKQKSALEKEDNYALNPWYFFGVDVLPYNYTNPTVGPVFQQLYFRQALQALIDQPQYIKTFDAGIGTVDNGLVPTFPPNNRDETSQEAKGQLNPFNAAKAVSLLKAHGWSVHPGGQTVCTKPGAGTGDCGAGVRLNQAASFSLLYASGSAVLANQVASFQSTLKSKAGITLALQSSPPPDVFSRVFTSCTYAAPCSGWDIADWAPGITESYPGGIATGETFFSLQADNVGDYQNARNQTLLNATFDAPTQAAEYHALYTYENYANSQLPYMLFPFGPYQITMYKKNLKGVVPQSIYGGIFPEYYRIG